MSLFDKARSANKKRIQEDIDLESASPTITRTQTVTMKSLYKSARSKKGRKSSDIYFNKFKHALSNANLDDDDFILLFECYKRFGIKSRADMTSRYSITLEKSKDFFDSTGKSRDSSRPAINFDNQYQELLNLMARIWPNMGGVQPNWGMVSRLPLAVEFGNEIYSDLLQVNSPMKSWAYGKFMWSTINFDDALQMMETYWNNLFKVISILAESGLLEYKKTGRGSPGFHVRKGADTGLFQRPPEDSDYSTLITEVEEEHLLSAALPVDVRLLLQAKDYRMSKNDVDGGLPSSDRGKIQTRIAYLMIDTMGIGLPQSEIDILTAEGQVSLNPQGDFTQKYYEVLQVIRRSYRNIVRHYYGGTRGEITRDDADFVIVKPSHKKRSKEWLPITLA